MRDNSSLKRIDYLLIEVFKRLGFNCDLTVFVGAVLLKTDRQKAEMALWALDNHVTDPEKIPEKALEMEREASANSK